MPSIFINPQRDNRISEPDRGNLLEEGSVWGGNSQDPLMTMFAQALRANSPSSDHPLHHYFQAVNVSPRQATTSAFLINEDMRRARGSADIDKRATVIALRGMGRPASFAVTRGPLGGSEGGLGRRQTAA